MVIHSAISAGEVQEFTLSELDRAYELKLKSEEFKKTIFRIREDVLRLTDKPVFPHELTSDDIDREEVIAVHLNVVSAFNMLVEIGLSERDAVRAIYYTT